jgi:uncharacterized protein
VAPGASRSEIVGRHGNGWKVRIAATPERGRANEALIDFLAATLGVTRERIQLIAGRSGRRKVVEVDGIGAEEVGRRLNAAARQQG